MDDEEIDEEEEDLRVRAPLNGKIIGVDIDLCALDEELGGHGLNGSDDEIVVASEDSPVTAEELAAAIEAHVPPPSVQQRIDAIVDAAPDWRSAMKALAAEGLLTS